jgi:hypothetical protein
LTLCKQVITKFHTRVAENAGGSVMAYYRDGSGMTAPLISDSGATYTPEVSERRTPCVDGVSSCDLCARIWLCCLFCRINGEIEVGRSW